MAGRLEKPRHGNPAGKPDRKAVPKKVMSYKNSQIPTHSKTEMPYSCHTGHI